MKKVNVLLLGVLFIASIHVHGQQIIRYTPPSVPIKQFEKSEFDIVASCPFSNPYDFRDVSIDMELISPSGKHLTLPAYFENGTTQSSTWKSRFAPQEHGKYQYTFVLYKKQKAVMKTKAASFEAAASSSDGFLHIHDYWTLKFDSGKPFRGIGENIGWESRSFENPRWTYDYLLPTLSSNGANFFRTWMCVWNLPLYWKNVRDTKRYTNSSEYFNPGGVKRTDELMHLIDSLNLYMMLTLDWHGALIDGAQWDHSNFNVTQGGPAKTPVEFFTNAEAKAIYKNKLRYIIARWGYSKNIAAWEFFNEIDNAAFTSKDSVRIPHEDVTAWHDEISTFLKKIDPYHHIVTTSISHRDIDGMNSLKNIDLNQKHIYNHTNQIAPTIRNYIARYQKPYVIGEFGYDWNWDNVKPEAGPGFDYDYKRGLWYGLMSPTPILPMTWWWEFFDERNMTPYFRSVREISDAMLEAGKGKFEEATITGNTTEALGVKCGDQYFVYLLNDSDSSVTTSFSLLHVKGNAYAVKHYNPDTRHYSNLANVKPENESLTISNQTFEKKSDMILILVPLSTTGSN